MLLEYSLCYSLYCRYIDIFYNRAMASTSGKEQFLKQFETIVAGVKRNKAMVINSEIYCILYT